MTEDYIIFALPVCTFHYTTRNKMDIYLYYRNSCREFVDSNISLALNKGGAVVRTAASHQESPAWDLSE